MRELHLFAGCGGGILGGILLGHTCVCAVEIDKHCRKSLLRRQLDGMLPRFPIWDDVRTFDGTPWRGNIDCICGGFPCQPFSKCAHGNNITEKDRWADMRRIIGDIKPPYVFAENVCQKPIDRAADELEKMGYTVKCMRLSAKNLGADHIRKRYWLLAHSNMHGEFFGPEYAKTQMLRKLRSRIWEGYPAKLRVDDGMADRMDRIRAAGNGQVPIVAAIAFLKLLERF